MRNRIGEVFGSPFCNVIRSRKGSDTVTFVWLHAAGNALPRNRLPDCSILIPLLVDCYRIPTLKNQLASFRARAVLLPPPSPASSVSVAAASSSALLEAAF